MSHPIPILFLNHDLSSGGAERALLNLLSGLDRSRFAPTLWVRRLAGDLLPRYRQLDIEIREAPSIMAEGARRWLVWKLPVNALRLRRFAIVHSFCSNAWWTEPRSVRLAGVRGYVIRKSDRDMHGPARSWDVRHRLAHRIVAVSAAIFDQFYKGTPLAEKTRMIWNGVDTDQFRPRLPDDAWRRRLGVPPGAGLFVSVANLSPHKGQLHLLIALALAKVKAAPLYMIFAGRDLANGEMQRWAAELGVQDRAFFPGMIEDVPGLLAGCDGMALASPREGCSNAVMEGMSCGTPVVVTASGSHELIEDGVSGFVVGVGDVAAFVDRLSLLAADSRLRQRFGAAARERAVHRFNLPRMIQQYQDLYEELLAVPPVPVDRQVDCPPAAGQLVNAPTSLQ